MPVQRRGTAPDSTKEARPMVAILLALLLMALIALAVVSIVRWQRLRGDGSRRRAIRAERIRRRDEYLDTLESVNFYQLVVIFTVASIGGLILETLWCAVALGVWQHRYGMVWGPFSPLYGFGAVIFTVTLWKVRKQPIWVVFALSLVIGSLLEQFAGAVMEDGFHVTSWSYEHMPDAITKYVSLRMSLMWGMLGCIWCRIAMPEIVYFIGEPQHRMRAVVTVLLTAFLVIGGIMTLYVAVRKDARDQGIAPANAIERYIDERYDDTFMEERFQNAEFGQAA